MHPGVTLRSGYKSSLNGWYGDSSSPTAALPYYDMSLSLNDSIYSLGVLKVCSEVCPKKGNEVLFEIECDGVGGGIQNCGALGV